VPVNGKPTNISHFSQEHLLGEEEYEIVTSSKARLGNAPRRARLALTEVVYFSSFLACLLATFLPSYSFFRIDFMLLARLELTFSHLLLTSFLLAVAFRVSGGGGS